jgi:adenylate kinase
MIIAVSGTPATGKTSVARILKKMLGANLISLNELVKKRKIKSGYDRKRKTYVADESAIRKAVEKLIQKGETNIVEGHAAHIIKSDIVFVLRCNPAKLAARMKRKGWPANKIRENIEAELLDAITIEALESNKKRDVMEIDTSAKSSQQIAMLIKKLLNNHRLQKRYLAGKIDWTEQYKKYFSSL